ncbi:MAG: acetolactate synthase small subunit [Lachnospiraceae bacterium]|nr:acetolactate synthase small subunit [Lachnospiraceae bacterium]MDY5742995.1 acetolactate synthase small subunit [Lachnospiraceae bacterium]
MDKRVISLLVDNTAGVLSRVSGLFSRRGYNIRSLTVGETADPRFSRMTVVATGDEQLLTQIIHQLEKLIDVRDIKILHEDSAVVRELILLKVKASAQNRMEILSVCEIFRANIVDVGKESLVIELIGGDAKLAAFIELLSAYTILELGRTGATALSRGCDDVTHLE